ncbi:hypothetical protein Hamer_G031330, partial [Homarus americanus]
TIKSFVVRQTLVELQTRQNSDSEQALPANQRRRRCRGPDSSTHTTQTMKCNQFVEDLKEIVGQHQQQLTIEEMLEDDENKKNNNQRGTNRGMEEYNALYMSLVNAHQQALITRYLWPSLDDDGTTDDDIKVLGDLLVEELPQVFEDLMLRLGRCREGAGGKATIPPCLEPINQSCQAFHRLHQ